MAAPFQELSRRDRLIHEPSRLIIVTALSACSSADFVHLQSVTGLSSGNLSQHLAKLEAAGLITIEKTFVKKMPRTVLRLTSEGTRAINEHWQNLEQMRRSVDQWSAQERRTAEE